MFFPSLLPRSGCTVLLGKQWPSMIRWSILCPVINMSWMGEHFSSLPPTLDCKRWSLPKKSNYKLHHHNFWAFSSKERTLLMWRRLYVCNRTLIGYWLCLSWHPLWLTHIWAHSGHSKLVSQVASLPTQTFPLGWVNCQCPLSQSALHHH